MSDSVWPHRRQPTRLRRPWDSPGKNTGVGCHFLLQCMKVKSESEVAQSCPTLSDPMDCSPPGSSIHGILQAGVLEWGAIALSGSEIFKKLLITKTWPSSWSVSIIFSSSRDFKMLEQIYIYICVCVCVCVCVYVCVYTYIYKSYSVPFRDLAQCIAPSPWWIIMGDSKSKVSSVNKPDLRRQTNREPPFTCRVYKLTLGNNLPRYNPGSMREESRLVECFLWSF